MKKVSILLTLVVLLLSSGCGGNSLMVDEAEKETDREHLWFVVKDIKDGKITAELSNQPYWIAALKQGDIKTYPVEEVLTDWIIYSPDMNYTPDSAYLLK